MKTYLECLECGKKFYKTIGTGTVEVKCPGCGGYDTEVTLPLKFKMTNAQIIKKINDHYGTELAFQRKGETTVVVTGERTYKQILKIEGKDMEFDSLAVDYYGEYRGNEPWIDKFLIDLASKIGAYWEWETAGGIVLAR